MIKHFLPTIVIFILLGILNTSSAHAWSQNFYELTFLSRPLLTCAGIVVDVEDYFDGPLNDDRLETLQIDMYRRNWNNTTSRELQYIGTTGVWGGWGANRFNMDDMRNASGGCLFDPNDIYLRIFVLPKNPGSAASPGRYAASSFDTPLIRPPWKAQNDKVRVLIKVYVNNLYWPEGNVTLDSPSDGASFTTNVFPDRGFWATGPNKNGMTPSFGSFFDYGLRLVTGPGPEDFQWASPEVFSPGFRSGGETDCPAPRHLSDNVPYILPEPNIAYRPCDYPDANSHGTQMYKPGTNFTDPYPYDGNYRWNATFGIGFWDKGDPGNKIMASPQESFFGGHTISTPDQTARTFRLLTDIRPNSITINGVKNPDNTYVVGQNISFTSAIQNFSAGIAANTNTPVSFGLNNLSTGVNNIWAGSGNVGSYINPGQAPTVTSGGWLSTPGTYQIFVCANSPYTRLTVQGGATCMNQTFTVANMAPTCNISSSPTNSCTYTSPAVSCSLNIQWNSTNGTNINIRKNGVAIPGSAWNNAPTGNQPQAVSGTQTYSCYDNNTLLNSVTVTGTEIIPPTKTISGRVFNDKDKDGVFQAGEEWSGAALQVRISPAANGISSVMSTAGGVYTISQAVQGTSYTVSFTQPSGYKMTQPSSSQYNAVFVGAGCSPAANCSAAQDIENLNFGFSNSQPWELYSGLDVRLDAGIVINVPEKVDASCSDPNTTNQNRGYSSVSR